MDNMLCGSWIMIFVKTELQYQYNINEILTQTDLI